MIKNHSYIFIYLFINVTLLFGSLVESAYPSAPYNGHPRIYGDSQQFWDKKIQPFLDLACDTTYAQSDYSVLSARQAWEQILFSGSICKAPARRATFDTSHNTVGDYYQTTTPAFNAANRDSRGRNTMYLIRFLRSCFALNKPSATCFYTEAQLNDLVPRVIALEFGYWSNWGTWGENTQYKIDLGARSPAKFWGLFYDTFYNDLTPTQRSTIETKMDSMITAYNACYGNANCWPLQNGNNWTPYISLGFTYLTLARWYENAAAETTMNNILSILTKTRYTLESDGTFIEGLAHYAAMNIDNVIEIEFLIQYVLGVHVTQVNWDNFKSKSADWVMDNILTDSMTLDFGDSHATQYGALTPLFSWYIDEILGNAAKGSTQVDPCKMLRFWMNHYWYGGMDSGFDLHQVVVARNFSALVASCSTLSDRTGIYTIGGGGVFKKRLAPTPSGVPLYSRQNQIPFSSFAMQAKYNGYPHAEADFGGIVYSAFGARVIADMSYGTIAKTDKALQIDNGAAGANTLVIEDAWDSSNPTIINRSQFSPVRGTIALKSFNSGTTTYEYFELDGSNVYGRNQTTGGWLKRFKRYGISMPDGHYIMIDSITKKDGVASIRPSEYFYSNKDPANPTTCGMWVMHSTMSLQNGEVEIKPFCSNSGYQLNNGFSTAVTRIAGSSLLGGSFVFDNVITYALEGGTSTKYRSRFVPTNPITQPEARGFVIVSGANATTVPQHSISVTSDCPANNKCFEVQISSQSYRVELTSDTDGYLLNCVSQKVSGKYIGCTNAPSSTSAGSAYSSDDVSSSSIIYSNYSVTLFILYVITILF
ncbi:serine/threonine protein kinase [Tieghemostelium lacteum]|uniref:Serine/threonine protein kinase n=1 Tax=Tieghemostelium lacteum TaxID=361077 RepID=A0A151ZCB2_TIELA|nr:serine/threonine protein kinase [Tieghemostelium lacteum]|eukprot:KYQ91586.1 serine/threonine protein kinase [Tieghemostelium lacteum]